MCEHGREVLLLCEQVGSILHQRFLHHLPGERVYIKEQKVSPKFLLTEVFLNLSRVMDVRTFGLWMFAPERMFFFFFLRNFEGLRRPGHGRPPA